MKNHKIVFAKIMDAILKHGNRAAVVQPTRKEKIMVLIDTEEYQKLILSLMHSEEINEMIDATIYKDDERAKAAIRYGMVMALIYTCKCKKYVMSTEEQMSENQPNQI